MIFIFVLSTSNRDKLRIYICIFGNNPRRGDIRATRFMCPMTTSYKSEGTVADYYHSFFLVDVNYSYKPTESLKQEL